MDNYLRLKFKTKMAIGIGLIFSLCLGSTYTNYYDTERLDALNILAAYNGRDIGSLGSRKVLLNLVNDSEVVREFTIVNIWEQQQDEINTIFYLDGPENLQGTCYLLAENCEEMSVDLFLTTNKNVLSIKSDYFDQGLLGSDFGYQDLRMKWPVDKYDYRMKGHEKINNFKTWKIEALPLGKNKSTTYMYLYFHVDFPFLIGIDYFLMENKKKGAKLKPYKKLRVEDLTFIDNIPIATLIRMYTNDKEYSELKLIDAKFRRQDIDSRLFLRASLPDLKSSLHY